VNAARQKFSSQATSTSTVRKVNTARPIVNVIRPRNNVHKSHSPIRWPFNRTPAPKAKFANNKITTAGDKTVSVVGGNQETDVKTSAGKGPTWLFDLDYLTNSMNYQPVTIENKANITAEAKNGDEKLNANIGSKTNEEQVDQEDQAFLGIAFQAGAARASSTNNVNTASTPVNTASTPVNIASTLVPTASPSRNVSAAGPSYPDLSTNSNQDDSQIPSLKDIYEVPSDGIFTSSSYDDEGAVANFINLESTVNVDAKQEELLQFKTQQAWILVDLPFGKKKRTHRQDSVYKEGHEGYHAEILKKFYFMSVKTASTLIETQKPLVKDAEATDVDVHLYRSMIDYLMYLSTSRPDIMYAVCACSRFQVTLKTSHLHAVKRIFMYLKGQLKLGLWYPRESAFDLEAYSDSDYAGANLDKKSTTREAEYVTATSCYRYPFIRDAYEKKLIHVLKIYTDDNVANLLTKAFDVNRSMYSNRREKKAKTGTNIEEDVDYVVNEGS
nr:putative ribonuclease H-like domain-containing protein [Tanacetum cinerariifolium]